MRLTRFTLREWAKSVCCWPNLSVCLWERPNHRQFVIIGQSLQLYLSKLRNLVNKWIFETKIRRRLSWKIVFRIQIECTAFSCFLLLHCAGEKTNSVACITWKEAQGEGYNTSWFICTNFGQHWVPESKGSQCVWFNAKAGFKGWGVEHLLFNQRKLSEANDWDDPESLKQQTYMAKGSGHCDRNSQLRKAGK